MRDSQGEISKQKANRSKKAKGKGKILMDFKRDLATAIKRLTDTNPYTYSDTDGSSQRAEHRGEKERG